MEFIKLQYVAGTVLYSGIGAVLLISLFMLIDKCTPYNLWGEIVEKKNVALAILLGSMAIGLSIIISSAMH